MRIVQSDLAHTGGISEVRRIVLIDDPPAPPVKVERDWREVKIPVATGTVKGLKSTASPADDDWSIKSKHHPELNEVVHCPGGGTQVMIPRALHKNIETTSVKK